MLAGSPGAVVSADSLIEALWGEQPPATAATALQGHISKLRRLLGLDAIATREPGYVLHADVDATRFEQLVQEARALPSAERVERLRAALELWRGRALADVAAGANVLHELGERLEELRRDAHEDLFDAELALGRHVELVPELEAFARAEPARERAVGQLMLALYRGGRQADALAAYRRFRQGLNDTLGLEPTRALRDLERQILMQDPELAPPAGERPAGPRRVPLTAVAVGLDPGELDAEAYAQAAARRREAVRLVLERHGAVVERAGAALVGRFSGHEDDAARALAAAGEALALGRVGVASGDSFAGESAAIEQALRLQAGASEGALAVDQLTHARARPRELRFDRPLAGRTAERQRLRTLYDGALQNTSSVLAVLAGPAGIGKSRLAEELAASVAPGTRVLRARCLSYGDGIGLLPAAELVRAAAALPREADEDAARAQLAELLAGDERAATAVEQLLGVLGLAEELPEAAAWAMQRLLEAVARTSPTLVLVDDLHWASPAFAEIVERLAAEPLPVPLVVVASSRDAHLEAHAIALAPLDAAACGEIVAEMLGGEVEATALRRLAERSGGNPLFLEELVHDLRASGRLVFDGAWRLEGSGDTLPDSIRSLLAARIERLPDGERDLLTRGSVLGASFTLAELADVADDVEEPLAALVAVGLLQPAPAVDDLRFRHILIRDAAYASLPLGLKAELHERVAARFDAGAPRENEALAVHHLDQAYRAPATLGVAATPDALAARTAALGHALLAHGDAAAASSLLARTLELEPNRPLAAIELGRARFDAGDLAGADEAFSLVDHERAQVGRIEVRLHTDPECDLVAAGDEIERLLDVLREREDDDGVVEALLARAYVSLTRGRVGELAATLDEGLVVAQSAGRSRAEAEMLFLVCGASWYGPLPVPLGIRRCEGVLAGARDRPLVEAAALQALGVLRAMAGEFDLARECVTRARSIKKEIGQELGAAASAIDDGLVELLAGDYAAAETLFREGKAQLERLGEKGYFSTLTALLAKAVEAQGRPDEARALARTAAAAAAPDDVASQVHWRAAEARALGDEALAREAVELADATDFSLLRADAWAAAGRLATAREILEQKGFSASAIRAWCGATPAAGAAGTPPVGAAGIEPATPRV